jgi:hypothetical protein
MNPTIAAILEKNQTDIKAIVDKIGLEALLALTPHFLAIAKTAQEVQPKA